MKAVFIKLGIFGHWLVHPVHFPDDLIVGQGESEIGDQSRQNNF